MEGSVCAMSDGHGQEKHWEPLLLIMMKVAQFLEVILLVSYYGEEGRCAETRRGGRGERKGTKKRDLNGSLKKAYL
jgi:hypothetical protein